MPENLCRVLNGLVIHLFCLMSHMGPLTLSNDAFGSYDRLLDGHFPTSVCESRAIAASDVEAELSEQKFLISVLNTCKNADAQKSYVALRRLLITRPVLTKREFLERIAEPESEFLEVLFRSACKKAP